MDLRIADILAILILVEVLALYLRKLTGTRPGCLPPGPRGLPLLGNMFQLPTSFEWVTYNRWCKEFDTDIIHLNAVGVSIVVLNSMKAAEDLVEKRSTIYSSRPHSIVLNELMGHERNFAFMKYGEQWRIRRRLFDQAFNSTASRRYQPQEAKATQELLRKLCDDPDNFTSHIRYHAATIILSIAYGIRLLPENDPYVALAEEGVHAIILAARPGAYLVESLPMLKYVPSWLPGAGWKRQIQHWYHITKAMSHEPFEAAKDNIAKGTILPSFTSYCSQEFQDTQDPAYDEALARDVAATMYFAGADTTVSTLTTFFLAMLANPEAQRRAHQEIDRVVTNGHLPDFSDHDALPYITAIVKETFRWQNVLPMGENEFKFRSAPLPQPLEGVLHCLDEEDVYNGYRIPAGSVVVTNIWAMLHDETVYPEPLSFKPERFLAPNGQLDPNVQDPAKAVFGFGRR
ncbi:hypothetical protein PQX77_009288 [Marasmius sp. AFHP31]|nr:hypothetical protein PQX77_009288 [Marasmius sp. AFHP31]